LASRKNQKGASKIAVIGLGRFGTALARELMATGREVLGVDTDENLVQNLAAELTHVVTADCTSVDTLEELNILDFDRVVVAIGTDIEASILTASTLLEMGVKDVWAKATSDAHGRILRQLGVQHVVFPEKDMGKRIAHQVAGDQLDYVEIDGTFVMAKTEASADFEGKSLTELAIRAKYGVIVVATSHGDDTYEAANPNTVISVNDYLIVAGPKQKIEKFCQLN
jgi:trk system potassium uptake protein TrkA